MRLPSLSRKHGHIDSHHLARRQECPAEGPHKGGASHLRDKVPVDVHAKVHAVDNNGPFITNADTFTKAFGGQVAPG